MTSPDPASRIDELKARWEADPGSRVFVQLAEEYRRQGRTDEAIAVLEKGLADQPNYVSALVALGRCRLDGGDAAGAVEVLSRVTEQDPSHPLAGKLLVEAHLQTGEPEEAAKRLDLYRMMADSDPEIEELERRLGEARAPESAGGPGEPAPASELSDLADLELSFEEEDPASGDSAGGDDLFDLGPVEATLPREEPSEPAVEPPGPVEAGDGSAPSESAEEPFGLPRPPSAAPPSPPSAASEASQAGVGEPFGDLFGEEDLRRLSEGLGGDEEIFDLTTAESEPPAVPGVAEPAAPEPARSAAEEATGEPSRKAEGGDATEDATEEVTEEAQEATVTLGQLYMAQGHRAEAARIFRSILRRDPDNEISRRALAELEGERPATPDLGPVESVDVQDRGRAHEQPESRSAESQPAESQPAESQPAESQPADSQPAESRPAPRPQSFPQVAGGQGVTERKIAVLEDYLRRLRRATGA